MSEVFAKYNVLATFKGGMGRVHIVYDAEWGRLMALKTFLPPCTAESVAGEARIILDLPPHINIVPVHFCALWRDLPYLGMDCIVGPHAIGEGLHRFLRRRLLKIDQILVLAIQLCEGMMHLHANGPVLHLDLKPSNILIDATCVIKIGDFGIAQVVASGSQTSRVRRGTPGYMAPEQMRGERVTPSTDVYAFGIVLRQMLAEAKPTDDLGSQSVSVCADHLSELGRIVSKCIEPDSRNRYQQFGDLRRDLVALYKEVKGKAYYQPETMVSRSFAGQLNQALSWAHLGRSDRALELLGKLVKEGVNSDTVWYNMGNINATNGGFSEAIRCFERCLQITNDDVDALGNLAYAAEMAGETSKARSAVEKALSLDPGNKTARINKGWILGNAGDHLAALRQFEMVLQKEPNDVEALAESAISLHKLGRREEAMARVARASELAPGYSVVVRVEKQIMGDQ